jgi:hypothetical protein
MSLTDLNFMTTSRGTEPLGFCHPKGCHPLPLPLSSVLGIGKMKANLGFRNISSLFKSCKTASLTNELSKQVTQRDEKQTAVFLSPAETKPQQVAEEEDGRRRIN